ncbi:16S rRNA (guanine(966)-N(2))-methyltransferase RsmD [Alteromonas sp. MTD1]
MYERMIPLSATMKRVSRPSRAPSSAKNRNGVKKANSQRGNSVGQIRIIGGQWRGRKLPVLNAEGLRPTTDRNKETLFNWLMPYLSDARCLDVFAGSGGLGLEALSRYASHCDFVELDKQASAQLKENLRTLKINDTATAVVHNTDALRAIESFANSKFDIVFVDPPFGKGLVAPTLKALAQCVDKDSVIYLEHESTLETPPLPANWRITKEKRTSALVYMLIEIEA